MTHREKLEAIKHEVDRLEQSITEVEKIQNDTEKHFSINYAKFINKLNEITQK